jgi:hypothetical protein
VKFVLSLVTSTLDLNDFLLVLLMPILHNDFLDIDLGLLGDFSLTYLGGEFSLTLSFKKSPKAD